MPLAIDRGRTAFLAIDFENDIVDDRGKFAAFGIAEHAKRTDCLANTRRALEASRQAGILAIHVSLKFRTGHPEDFTSSPLQTAARKAGCLIEGTWGAEAHPEVKPIAGEPIVTKRRVGAFHGTNLETILRAKGIATLVLSGVATNFGVESTVRCAHDAGYDVVILRDCCASVNEESHNFAMDKILPNLAVISNSAEYIQALR